MRKGVGDLASIYSLNEVATSIWLALVKPHSEQELVQLVEQEFDGDREQIERDVQSFLNEMCSAGLVMSTGAAA